MPKRTLTAEQVSEIRRRLAGNETMSQLAKAFAVSAQTIWLIANGRTWKRKAPIICPHCHKAVA